MTPEDRLAEGLEKYDLKQKEMRNFIQGCALHFATLLLALGLGYYFGWGLTFFLWGAWWLFFTVYKVLFTKGDSNESKESES